MEYINIKVRYSTGAYHASVAGQKATASSTISAFMAGSNLINKLHPGSKVVGAETIDQGNNSKPKVMRFTVEPYSTSLEKVTAYCFASGHIQFGSKVPDGAIALAVGDEQIVREVVTASARLSRADNETLFVPGIPEASTQREGLTAMAHFIQWLSKSNQPGFRALGA